MDNKKYPESIMEAVRQRLDLEPHDDSQDDEIMAMSPNEVFDHVCNWNGLVGYSNTIKNWVERIYKIKL